MQHRSSTNFVVGYYALDGISLRSHKELILLDKGFLTTDRHIRDILDQHIVPLRLSLQNGEI